MKTIPLLLVLTATALLPAAASAGSPPDDPCGGTGGYGRVVAVAGDGFTVRRNADGRVHAVRLAGGATIRTAAGDRSLSDLAPGARVTLVGGPNPDGSFTADTVVVCRRGTGGAGRQPRRAADRPAVDPDRADTWSTRIDRAALLLVAALWLVAVVRLRRRRATGALGLLAFTVFFAYLVKVVDLTLFRFQSLLVLKHFAPDLMLNGLQPGERVQLTPLIGLTSEDARTSLLNTVLMVPFGLGLPLLARVRPRAVVTAGMAFSVAIEVLQWLTGLLGGVSFRVADINDVIFNTAGAAVGCALFAAARRLLPGIAGGRLELPTSRL